MLIKKCAEILNFHGKPGWNITTGNHKWDTQSGNGPIPTAVMKKWFHYRSVWFVNIYYYVLIQDNSQKVFFFLFSFSAPKRMDWTVLAILAISAWSDRQYIASPSRKTTEGIPELLPPSLDCLAMHVSRTSTGISTTSWRSSKPIECLYNSRGEISRHRESHGKVLEE